MQQIQSTIANGRAYGLSSCKETPPEKPAGENILVLVDRGDVAAAASLADVSSQVAACLGQADGVGGKE